MKQILYFTALGIALGACNQIPAEAYFNRGSPESLLDASSEVVNVPLISEASIQEVVQWVDQDQPTQAELYCLSSDPVCAQALETLEMFQVPVNYVSAADNMLTLVYDRVVARDCENRYINNTANPYNLHHPTFGCSNAVNVVQMVGDKRQFTNPALLDFRDGEKAVQSYEMYLEPLENEPIEFDTTTGGRAGS